MRKASAQTKTLLVLGALVTAFTVGNLTVKQELKLQPRGNAPALFELRQTWQSAGDIIEFGRRVSRIGDANGDGHADYVVHGMRESKGGAATASSWWDTLQVLSGVDGGLICEIPSGYPAECMGDGVVMVSSAGEKKLLVGGLRGLLSDAVFVFRIRTDVATLEQVWARDSHCDLRGGGVATVSEIASGRIIAVVVCAAGDGLTGECATRAREAARVQMERGKAQGGMDQELRELRRVHAASADADANKISLSSHRLVDGTTLWTQLIVAHSVVGVVPISDWDGDGVSDVLCPYRREATRGEQSSSANGASEVLVVSGATGNRVRAFAVPDGVDVYSACEVSDIDGDSQSDLVLGMPGYEVAGTVRGRVVALSGATGVVLWSVVAGQDYSNVGWSIAAVGDLNRDSIPEVAVGAPAFERPSEVRILDGASGNLLQVLAPPVTDTAVSFGQSLATSVPSNSVGGLRLFVGAPNGSQCGAGGVYVYESVVPEPQR